jgi:hypothetical protein
MEPRKSAQKLSAETTIALTEFVTNFNRDLSNVNIKVTLMEMTKLTILKPNQAYSTRHHIGLEVFSICGAYLGKKNDLVLVMKPKKATDYTFAEIASTDLKKFAYETGERAEEFVNGIAKYEEIKSGEERLLAEKRKADMEEKNFQQYQGLGYGTW